MRRCGWMCVIAAAGLLSFGCDKGDEPAPTQTSNATPARKAAPVASAAPHGPETGVIGKPVLLKRSPLSSAKAIAERLNLSTVPAPEYKLDDYHFMVFVPPRYDPAKPMGLLVLLNYKPNDALPAPIFTQLNDMNLALVVCKEFADAWWIRAGLALDAVHNLKLQYKIDPRRVYVMGEAAPPSANGEQGAVAQRLGLAYPDVFTGTIIKDALFYRRTRAPNGGSWPAKMKLPESHWFNMAKSRPIVIALGEDGDAWRAITQAYRDDGFKHVDFRIVTLDQYHYPNYTDDWLPGIVQFLDAGTKDLVLTPATTKPAVAATKPATTRAAK